MKKPKKKKKPKQVLDLGAASQIIRSNTSTRAHTVHRDKKKEAARKACRRQDWSR